MFRLTVLGPDTQVLSSLCAKCPHAAAGCCVAPPRFAWADIARVVQHGGRDFLLAKIADGSLVPFEHGLTLKRVKARVTGDVRSPRVAKCIFHEGGSGCTITADRRPATCNYYVCESVYEKADREGHLDEVARARTNHDALVERFVAWDEALALHVKANYPDGVRYDATFLDALAETFAELRARTERTGRATR